MSLTIEQLELEISSDGTAAAHGIDSLANSLIKLKGITQGSLGLAKVVNQINKLKESLSAAMPDTSGIERAIEPLKRVSEAAQDMAKPFKDMPKIETPTVDTGDTITGLNQIKDAVNETKSTFSGLPAPEKASAENIKQAFSGVGDGVKAAFSKISSGAKTAFNALSSGAKKAASFIGGLVSKMKSLVPHTEKSANAFGKLGTMMKRILLYRLLRQMITATINAIKEGTQNLARYSSEFNASMSQMSTGSLYLKNSLGAMLAPAIQALIPIFTSFINVVVQAANAIGMFFSALGGATTFTKAKEYAVDYADALGGAAKAQQNFTAGFDELNVISEQAAGAGAGQDFSQMFETVEIPSGITDFAKSIKDAIAIEDWYGLGKLIAEKLNEGMRAVDDWINNVFRPLGVKWAKNIAEVLNGMVDYFDWTLLGKTIADGINAVADIVNTFLTTFNFENLGIGIGKAINGLFDNIEWDLLGQVFANGWNALIDTLYGIVKTTNWENIGSSFAEGLQSFTDTIKWDKAAEALGIGLNGALNALYTFLTSYDWGALGSQLSSSLNLLVSTINWSDVGATLAALFNTAIDFLGNAIADFDWGGLGTSLGQAINKFFADIQWAELGQTVSDFFKGVLDFIGKTIQETDWKKIGEDIKTFLVNIDWNGIISSLAEVIGMAIGGIAALLWGAIEDAVSSIADFWKQKFEEAGGNIPQGLWNGIIEGLGDIGSWIKTNIAEPFIKGFKNVFGIHSPATLMEPLGENISAGVGVGIDDGAGSILSSISGVASSLLSTLSKSLGISGGSSKEAKETGAALMSSMAEGITQNLKAVTSAIEQAGKSILDTFNKSFGITGNQSTVFKTAGTTLMSSLSAGITEAAKGTVTTIQTAANSLLTALNQTLGIVGMYSTKTRAVGEIIMTSIGAGITSKSTEVNNIIKTACENMLKTMETAFGISGGQSSKTYDIGKVLMESLGKGITAGLASAQEALRISLQSLSSMLDGFLKDLEDKLSSIKNAAKSVSSSSSSSTSTRTAAATMNTLAQPITVQGYANGGVVTSGELFVARENGISEFVGSFGGHTAVANNDQIISGIENGVERANMRQNQILSAAVQLLQIIADKDPSFNVDGKALASAVARGQRQQGFNIYPNGEQLSLNY